MGTSRDKRIERAQLRVVFSVPFFSPGVARLPVVWDDSIPTACTDGREIRWNGAWFDSLQDSEVVTVLCHEVCHALLGHMWRAPAGADHEGWNEACDHAVNLMLTDFSQIVMSKHLADPFPFPQGAFCADPQYRGMAEEQIYARLPKKPPGGGARPGPGAGGSVPGGQAGGRPGKVAPGARQPFGEFEVSKPGVDAKKLKGQWDQTLIQSAHLSKGRGDLPADLRRLVEDMVNPQIPWWELVRHWLRELANDDWDFVKPNRLYGDSPFILPSLRSEKLGPIVFATDTSGSIDSDMLARFQSEKQACLDDMRPARLLDIYCDSKIQQAAEYRAGDTISRKARGGGGTSFKPVFELLEKQLEVPRCLVYLTDLDGDFPKDDPGYPVLWVTWTEGGKAPFGEVIYAKEA